MITLPGTYGGNGSTVINGLGQGFVTSEIVKVEGQDASNRLFNNYEYTTMNEPNVDAIQEIAFQVSNYAPEFGQAGSAVINTTMKSGTNRYHGTGFEYFVNEDLNAGYPFSNNGSGEKFRPRSRKNDFGGTLGGPISIPKLYNGKNKTFFFWAYEEYRLTQLFSFNDTVPTTAFLNGDFSAVSPNGNCSSGRDGIPMFFGEGIGIPEPPVLANESTIQVARSCERGYAIPFAITCPRASLSPTALAFEKLFPAPSNNNLTSNYSASVPGGQYSAIPSLKVDQIISQKDKVSFYWSRTNAESAVNSGPQAADGLPFSIGAYRGAFIPTSTYRLNYDRTLTPTILLHFGVGYLGTSFSDQAPFLNFNPSQFDLDRLPSGPPDPDRQRNVHPRRGSRSRWRGPMRERRDAEYRDFRPIAVANLRATAYIQCQCDLGEGQPHIQIRRGAGAGIDHRRKLGFLGSNTECGQHDCRLNGYRSDCAAVHSHRQL